MLMRRAQLAWALIPFFVVVMTGAAYFILVDFSRDTSHDSASFAEVASDSLYAKTYVETLLRFAVQQALRESAGAADFQSTFEPAFVAFIARHDTDDGRFGTFFKDVTERRTYTFNESKGVYTIHVPNVQQTTRSKKGAHVITRTFDIDVRFTPSGLL